MPFAMPFTEDHARLLIALAGCAFTAAAFLAGSWSQHRRRVRFQREDLVTSAVVIELYGIAPGLDGHDTLHIVTQGGSIAIEHFFRNAELVRHVQKAANKHPGLLRLPSPVAHRMMMDEGKDIITGLDAKANMDFVHGRPTREDETLFAFAAYPEIERNGSRLHDQVARLVLMVASAARVARLADKATVDTLAVAHAGYRPRCQRLHDFALEWQRLGQLPTGQRSSATDKVWQITVRTALGS